MQIGLRITTDHAVRILCYLNRHQEETPTAISVAENTGMAVPNFMKIINQLKYSGLVKSVQGRKGGYKLGRSAEKISLLDIVQAMEGNLSAYYVEEKGANEELTEDLQRLQDVVHELQGQVASHLENIMLSELSGDTGWQLERKIAGLH